MARRANKRRMWTVFLTPCLRRHSNQGKCGRLTRSATMNNQILTPTVMYALCKNRSLKQSLNEGPSIPTRKHEDQRQQSQDLLNMLKNRAIAMSSDANFPAVPKSVYYRGRAHRTKLKSFRPTDKTDMGRNRTDDAGNV